MSDCAKILIITVVKKGLGDIVIESSMKAGAEGATLMFGRGLGIHEKKKIMGVSLEPEKEIILSVVCEDLVDEIIKEITAAVDLEKPGTGIAFTVPIDKIFGISHYLPKCEDEAATTENCDLNTEATPSENEDVKPDTDSENKE